MKIKLFTVLLSLLTLALTTAPISAQQIPEGFALLVPLSSFGGQTTTTQNISVVEISPTASALRTSSDFSFIGEDRLTVTATLRDAQGQPATGQAVNLISSRTADTIRSLQPTTNSNGEIVFEITTSSEGVSTFTAIDQASGQVIAERPRVVFLKNSSAIGGNLLKSDLLAEAGDGIAQNYDQQVRITFPQTVSANTPYDITINVADLAGKNVEGFTGTISFESSDNTAVLPNSYTFTELDRGEHTFAKAVTFATSGFKNIIVSSNDSVTQPAELSIETLGEQTIETIIPIIESPGDDFLTNETLSLIGTAPTNSNLAILAGGELVGTSESDENGDFLATVEDLPDGNYEISIAVLKIDNSIGEPSASITVTIDADTPELEEFSLEPDSTTISVGSVVRITAKSESGLLDAVATIGAERIDLFEGLAGIYTGEFIASELGTYPLNFELTDEAGNQKLVAGTTILDIENAAPQITIVNIQVEPKNQRVDLSWDPPINPVDHYEILYGTDQNNLSQKFTTFDSRTAWYVGELNNDTVSYFQIISFDTEGSANGQSEVISATPTSLLGLQATACDSKILLNWKEQADERVASYKLAYGIESGKYVEERILPGGTNTSEWELRDLINGVEYFITIRGIDANNNPVFSSDEEVSATPVNGACHGSAAIYMPTIEQPIQLWQKKDLDGNTVLVWSPTPGVAGYRVYAGTQPNFFDLPTVTVATPYLRPDGLMANEDYYFAVRAIYGDGRESTLFSNVTKVEVGPALIIFGSLVLALGGGWMLRRKRHLDSL